MNEENFETLASVANIQETAFRALKAAAGDEIMDKPDSEVAADIAARLNAKLNGSAQ